MNKRFVVTLSREERDSLHAMVSAGKAAARKLTHARILLLADEAEGAPAFGDRRIVEALRVGVCTVARVRQRFVEEGFEAALVRKEQVRPSKLPVIDGRAEAQLSRLACSAPPEGRSRWTMELLADRMIRLGVVQTVSRETIRRTMKKTRSSRG